jgi:PDDEXK-like uncharacterized protein DUF3799
VIEKPGLYSIPLIDYIADPCQEPSLSASVAHTLITQSPIHAFVQHPRLNKGAIETGSTKMDIGTIVHGLVLEGDESRLVIVEADDWRTKVAKETRDEARRCGLVPVLAGDMGMIREIAGAALSAIASSELASAFTPTAGKAEQTLIWKEGDIWLRSRPDWLTNDHRLIIDLKTTSASAEPMAWLRTMLGNGNDLQAVLGLRGIRKLDPKARCQFVFWVVEQNPPYASSFVGLSPQFLEMSEHKLERAIRLWSDCTLTNTWSGYPSQVCWIEPPSWEWTREQEKGLA